MNMNSVKVHTFNKASIAKQGQLLLAGVVMSSLLTACGGSSGPSAEETAARAAVTAAQSAATAAASAAQVAAAAAQAADKIAADKAAADAAAAAKTAAQASTQAAAKAAIDKSATDEADQAKSAAAAAQVSADKAAASAVLAAQAAADKAAVAAQAAADKAAAIATARKEISTVAITINGEVQAAQSARASAGSAALRAEQLAASYPEVAEALNQTKTYAAQAATEAGKAVAEKTQVEKIQTDAAGIETVADIQTLVTQAKAAEQAAKTAREAAEKALQSTRTAASQVASEVAAANAARRYTKLDSAGNALPASAPSWECVKENATGKVWESKTSTGLRNSAWRYRHFHNYAGYASTRDSNGRTLCEGLGNCDAYSYVNRVNNTGLCGRSQWRLPTMEELLNLVQVNDNGQRPNIDLKVFPDTVNKPNEAAYCSENLARTAEQCGYAPGTPVSQSADGRIECNYQGVDYGLPITASNLRGGSMVALRHYGEVPDGLPTYPTNNWICYTRLISNF